MWKECKTGRLEGEWMLELLNGLVYEEGNLRHGEIEWKSAGGREWQKCVEHSI